MARTYAYLFGLGATLLLITLFLPHDPHRQVLPLLVAAGLAYGTTIGFIVGYDRLPLKLFQASPALGSTLIAIVLYWSGVQAITAYSVYFFWVTLSAAYFFSLRITFAQIGFATTLFAIVLGLRSDASDLPLLHMVMMAGSLFVAGGLMVLLRNYAARAQQEGDRVKAEFIATVSHELRTPLTSIIGYLDLLKEDEGPPLPERQRGEFMGVVDRNSRRLLRLVTDLLFVAQVQASGVQLNRGPFDLADVARESVETFTSRAEREGIVLRSDIEGGATCIGDRERMGQVIDNLLSNAIKFTKQGGEVIVSLRSDETTASVEVSDSGIGISPEDQSRLFEDFYRASGAKRHLIEGTGLGLAIVRAIVEAHGGEVSFASAEGEGSSFRFSVPTAPPAATSSDAGHPPEAPARPRQACEPRSRPAVSALPDHRSA
jgi:signal transduction histidine kinase